MYKEIDSSSLKKELENNSNLNIIDIRDNYHYISGRIQNAKNIPSSNLITNPSDYLNKDQTYYVYCEYGSTSKRMCQYLSNLGYNVVNIRDGYYGYEDSI